MDRCFLRLSDEIMYLVLDQSLLMEPTALTSLLQVSRQFHQLLLPRLYDSVVFTTSKIRYLSIAEADPCAAYIRKNVYIYTHMVKVVGEWSDWDFLSEILVNVGKLDILSWSCWKDPLPLSFLERLKQRWPQLSIHLDDLYIGHQGNEVLTKHDLDLMEPFFGDTALRSIKANINYDEPKAKKRLVEIARSCPNLEVFHLRVLKEDGRVEWHFPNSGVPLDFGVEEVERLGPLLELVYESRWNHHGYDYDEPTDSIPGNFFDWARIQHLELRGFSMREFINSIQGQITHLQTLKIENFSWDDTYRSLSSRILNDFLSNIQGLVTLELINETDLLPVHLVTQQGNSLESLSLYPPRKCYSPYGHIYVDTFSVDDLEAMAFSCTEIMSLTLQVLIGRDLPYEYLAALGKFPRLETLRLYASFDEETSFDEDHRCLLETDKITVLHAASYIQSHKAGKAFKKVEMVLGEWEKETGSSNLDNRYADTYSHERPDIIFTCQFGLDGEVKLDDNSWKVTDPAWEGYLDRDGRSEIPGQTYPLGLTERMKAGEEADLAMAGIYPVDDAHELESLFGDDSTTESPIADP